MASLTPFRGLDEMALERRLISSFISSISNGRRSVKKLLFATLERFEQRSILTPMGQKHLYRIYLYRFALVIALVIYKKHLYVLIVLNL